MRHLILCAAALTLAACAQPNGQPPATSPDTVKAKPTKPKITAAQLLGQSDAWLLAQMGDPTFKRADMHANLWQYKNGQCVLNVFLYADTDAENAPVHVLHFDARNAQGQNTDRNQCLSVLQD